MAKRHLFEVLTIDSEGKPGKETVKVWANGADVLQDGSVVFHQMREGKYLAEDGQEKIGWMMTPVLILPNKAFHVITQIGEGGLPLYTESGAITALVS